MRGENHPKRAELREARERTIERLTNAFVRDELTLEEYEARVDGAYHSTTVADLSALASDLSVLPEPRAAIMATHAEAEAEARSLAVRAEPPRRGLRTLAILGNVERRGNFRVEDQHRVLSVLGNVELDFRGVELPPGVTTIHVRAVLGNVEIVVPPDLYVECNGASILGNFGNMSRVPSESSLDGPLLRIEGRAVLGSVEVRTLPRHSAAARGALPPHT